MGKFFGIDPSLIDEVLEGQERKPKKKLFIKTKAQKVVSRKRKDDRNDTSEKEKIP